jgi:NAD(P)-dependent dehydrogenase (short-subunit alcohol dehydrogenase family)
VKQFTAKVPLGRLTDIQDVVDFVFFLTVSGDYCTGQAFNVTGGREMH